MGGWRPGEPAKIQEVLRFPAVAQGLNGGCLIAPNVVLLADPFAGLIWRVDLAPDGRATASIWLQHYSMGHDPNGGPLADQPGINGLRYVASTGHPTSPPRIGAPPTRPTCTRRRRQSAAICRPKRRRR